MKLKEVKSSLTKLNDVIFQMPNGSYVPLHFHITEVGMITKNFIDCGGAVREEKVVNFQLWEAADYDHRLAPEKLLKIIELSECTLNIDQELEIEVEYQAGTIGKFGLTFNGVCFQLTNKMTACLAEDACGIPEEKRTLKLSNLGVTKSGCTPGGSCC